MKKILKNNLILLSLPLFLISCGKTKTKFHLDKVENGQFLSISAEGLYEKVITNNESIVVLFKIDDCASCKDAYEIIDIYVGLRNCIMYYLDFSRVDENQYNLVYQTMTYVDDAYNFPKYGNSLSLPAAYGFLDKAVVFEVKDNFVNFFEHNIEYS